MAERSYLHFQPTSGWSGIGAVTPFEQERFRTSAFEWRQLASLKLPPLPESFTTVKFEPFAWAFRMRGRSD